MPPILDVLQALRERLVLSACEFFSASALDLVCSARGLRRPLDGDFPFYLLVEFDLPPAQADAIDDRSNRLAPVSPASAASMAFGLGLSIAQGPSTAC